MPDSVTPLALPTRPPAPGPGPIIRAATRTAWADLRGMYTPVTWTVGWLGRILMQVAFFGLIGLLLQDSEAVRYLFIGQAVMACVVETFMAVASTTWERLSGTLGLLVAAPGALWPVLVGRSVQWLPSGIATSSIALFGLGPAFGVRWHPSTAAIGLCLVVLTALTMYPVALSVAALVLRGPRWRNVASNVSHTLVMLITGVTVPTTFWPDWVQDLALGMPLTHGLAAIRDVQESAAGWDRAGAAAALMVGLGACWLALAAAAFTLFARMGRADGSIDLRD